MRNCPYSAAPRVSVGRRAINGEALQHRTPSAEPLGCKASLGVRARLVVTPWVASERYEVISGHASGPGFSNPGAPRAITPHAGSDSVSAVLASSDRRSGHVDQP